MRGALLLPLPLSLARCADVVGKMRRGVASDGRADLVDGEVRRCRRRKDTPCCRWGLAPTSSSIGEIVASRTKGWGVDVDALAFGARRRGAVPRSWGAAVRGRTGPRAIRGVPPPASRPHWLVARRLRCHRELRCGGRGCRSGQQAHVRRDTRVEGVRRGQHGCRSRQQEHAILRWARRLSPRERDFCDVASVAVEADSKRMPGVRGQAQVSPPPASRPHWLVARRLRCRRELRCGGHGCRS